VLFEHIYNETFVDVGYRIGRSLWTQAAAGGTSGKLKTSRETVYTEHLRKIAIKKFERKDKKPLQNYAALGPLVIAEYF
jgi:hypothetical protein